MAPRRNPQWKAIPSFSVGMTFALLTLAGCGGQPSADVESDSNNANAAKISLPDLPAPDYLRQVFARYRTAIFYQDRGEVRLRVERDGRVTRRVAPMSVTFSTDLLWVAAYDARLWSDSKRTLGWIADETTNLHDSQVVIGASTRSTPSSRPELDDLLRDPLLTARMTAGLGGPPPQLEWLFDPSPMAKLFDEPIEFTGTQRIDDVDCVIVRAEADGQAYRFWIDRRRSLIHRVELPVSVAGEPIQLDGYLVRSLELVLLDAKFQAPAQPLGHRTMPDSNFPKTPKYVGALVPLPPLAPHRLIGRMPKRFRGRDLERSIAVTEQGSDRQLALFVHAVPGSDEATDARNLALVTSLSQWLRRSQSSVQSNLRPVVLVDKSAENMLVQAGLTRTDWLVVSDEQDAIAKQLGLSAGQVMLVDEKFGIVWVGDPTLPLRQAALTATAIDTLAGIDVSKQLRREYSENQKAYQSKLEQVSIEPPAEH